VELARKTVTLRRTGGSQAVVLPAAWLRALGVADTVDLVQTEEGIVVRPPRPAGPSIEDEPEFAAFLDFLAKDSLAHTDALGDVGELVEDDELLRGVEAD
jgi:virulence-associated protein VagC